MYRIQRYREDDDEVKVSFEVDSPFTRGIHTHGTSDLADVRVRHLCDFEHSSGRGATTTVPPHTGERNELRGEPTFDDGHTQKLTWPASTSRSPLFVRFRRPAVHLSTD